MSYDGRQVQEFLRIKYHQPQRMSQLGEPQRVPVVVRAMTPADHAGDGRSVLPAWMLGGLGRGRPETTRQVRWRRDGLALVVGFTMSRSSEK